MVLFSDSVVAGAVSGGVTRLLIAPLDVLKVRFQLQLEAIRKVHLELDGGVGELKYTNGTSLGTNLRTTCTI